MTRELREAKNYEAARASARQVATLAAGLVLPGSKFISIGQNCNTAKYLQLVGGRIEAYPFDWIFSSPEIVEDCIRDRFATFLDRKFYIEGGGVVGHAKYHRNLFNHRNPLQHGNYDYYQRCVTRFMQIYESDQPVVFVSTALPEHHKRPAWREGFVFDFGAPKNVDLPADYEQLIRLCSRRPAHTAFFLIEQRTEMPHPGVAIVDRQENVVVLRHDACGESTGIQYLRADDDLFSRTVFETISQSGAT